MSLLFATRGTMRRKKKQEPIVYEPTPRRTELDEIAHQYVDLLHVFDVRVKGDSGSGEISVEIVGVQKDRIATSSAGPKRRG